jgi:outer membrane protein OmpA-like peptidoglycan-associated protein/tetratricopeptide (TPR) repeat protein
MKKFCLVLLMTLMAVAALQAQTRLKRKGDALYAKLSYQLAIPFYEHHLKKHIDNDATTKLAECYRLTHNYDKAAEWYSKVILIPNAAPISYFYCGHALLQQGNLPEAKAMFQKYDQLVMDDARGKNFVRAIDRYEELMRDSMRIEIKPMPFNTSEAEFGVFPYQDGIIFAGARIAGPAVVQEFNWLDSPFLNFFYVTHKKDSVEWDKPELLKGDVNTRYHESNFTMADGATEFYFTRNNFIDKKKGKSDEGIIKLKLYKGQINGLETSAIEELPLNSDDYSTTHPSVSADGERLYFASDMPGGEGGKDIYYCTKSGAGWSAPINLKAVNTSGDEMFPFVHQDGTLYFSSDGHPGLGHLDIFYVKPKGDQQVVNMGYPVNSAWDDFAFYLDANEEDGYLSSDREGGQGNDDIYSLKMKRPMLEIIVLDSVAYLPIEGAKVTVRDLTDNSEQSYVTDSSGFYAFKTYFAHAFEITVETPDFGVTKSRINTDAVAGQLVFTKEVNLWTPPPSITGLVIDDSTKERLAGSEVEFLDLRRKASTVRVADRNGRFHIKLEPTSYYEINVRRKGYMTYTARVSTTLNAFDGDTIIPLKMEKIPFNKPIRLENIHYDFDKWTIRADAYNDLIYLGNLMKKNPTLIVELGSHTDCRGSDAYNEALAQKRANSARIFLIDLGIEPMRIKAKGYGEYQLSNKCDDGVPCTDKQHDDNRRTEFKIIGEIEGVDMKNSVLETKQGG